MIRANASRRGNQFFLHLRLCISNSTCWSPIETDKKSFHLLSHRTVPNEAGGLPSGGVEPQLVIDIERHALQPSTTVGSIDG